MTKCTKKYFIEFVGNEFELSGRIKITQKDFISKLENAIKLQEQTKDSEFYVEVVKNEYDKGNYILTSIRVSTGTSDMYLDKLECKEGFYFTK